MASATTARRVVRSLSAEYRFIQDRRMEVSYRGGWQNATQKLQWFWFGFKKYGFMQNFANMLRMREAWWETGEKRLIGMDAMGHRYWESDESSRRFAGGNRWIDYPHHFQWADWTKITYSWSDWARMSTGRSPPQLEALHKELGPHWRDYHESANYGNYWMSRADHHRMPTLMDGCLNGEDFTDPWDPSFKIHRRRYGQQINKYRPDNMTEKGFTGLYDVDEFDPNDGAVRKLEHEGISPSFRQQQHMKVNKDNPMSPYGKFLDPMTHNATTRFGILDGGKSASEIWWEYRKDEADKTRRSREKVSAFDQTNYSPVNETGTNYGFMSHYKTLDADTHTGAIRHNRAHEKWIKNYRDDHETNAEVDVSMHVHPKGITN